MLKKEDISRSVEFFNNLDLKPKEIDIIFDKFREILTDREIKRLLKDQKCMKEIEEEDGIQEILKKLIPYLDLKDLNYLLQKLIKDESLTEYIQDMFLEKIL
jgi:hypothetical protein